MASVWNFYQCTVKDKPASIYLDMALRQGAPDRKRTQLLIVRLDLRHPHPGHGMSSDEEFDVLGDIEDQLVEAFKADYGACYAGRITTDGRREFYFYSTAAGNLAALTSAALAPFSGYVVKAWSQSDPEWKQYLDVLYPSGAALRWIKDQGVIEALEKAGDTHAIARPVTHFSYFPSDARRAAFARSVENAGFKIGKLRDNRPPADPLPYGLVYQLAQTPTLIVMTETTSLLSRLSEKNAGEYDGWECAVTGPNARPWWRFWG